jgi:ABC-type branched-subunit amino acid transport system ATPase component
MSEVAEPVLVVRGLRKAFGGLRVIDDVGFTIAAGETVAIVGPNGSGKTTTLNMIAGSVPPDGGEIRFGGRDITHRAVWRRADDGIARTFQNGRVFGNLTVGENVVAGTFRRLRAVRPFARLRGLPFVGWLPLLAELVLALVPSAGSAERARLANDAEAELTPFGTRLAPRIGARAFLFSYANRRRIEIARALAARPALLLLDEPAAGMNTAETLELQTQLLALRASGQTMLLIEHKLDFVRALADRVIVLDGGREIFAGSPATFADDPAVLEAYVGRAATPLAAVAESVADAREHAPLLALTKVDATYGTFAALTGVSLAVGAGEIVSLLGGNASGKSTTMKVILGLRPAVHGTIAFGEHDITRTATSERIRLGIASVPEARRIFPALTVDENLRIGAFVRGGQRLDDDFARVFALFPRLAERRRQAGGTLSGGEQQMLAIGRALMSRPRLLCLDEPTMGLSPRFVDDVLAALVAINRAGTSVLIVEQNVSLALGIADRGYVLAGGIVVAEGTASELRDSALVREAYLGVSPA